MEQGGLLSPLSPRERLMSLPRELAFAPLLLAPSCAAAHSSLFCSVHLVTSLPRHQVSVLAVGGILPWEVIMDAKKVVAQ